MVLYPSNDREWRDEEASVATVALEALVTSRLRTIEYDYPSNRNDRQLSSFQVCQLQPECVNVT